MAQRAISNYTEEGVEENVSLLSSNEDISDDQSLLIMYEQRNALLFQEREITAHGKSLGKDFHFIRKLDQGAVGIKHGNISSLAETIKLLTEEKKNVANKMQSKRNTIWSNGTGKNTKHHLDIVRLGGKAGWLKAELQGSNKGSPGGTISQVNFPEETLATRAAREKIIAKLIQGAGTVRNQAAGAQRPEIFEYSEDFSRRRFMRFRRAVGGLFRKIFRRN